MTIPVFKPWVPEWIIRLSLLLVVLPGLILFVVSISNINAAAGYYGISPNDVQYTFIIFYAAMASFLVMEGRFFKYIASKEYLLIGVMLLMGSCLICYYSKSFALLLCCRYFQGILTSGTLNITLTLMFSRLHSERAREIGFAVVYCVLLSAIPFSTVATAVMIDNYDFNIIYKAALFSYLPGALFMFLIMNNVRLNRKMPLFQLDWASFTLYTTAFCLFGYIVVYGQQYEWFEDNRICAAFLCIAVLVSLFVWRQGHLKRPYLYLKVLKRQNFLIGAILLFVFYLCRGSFGVTTNFMGTVLGLDPVHTGRLLIFNIAAIIIAVIISSRLVLMKKPIRLILLYGFTILLVFHVYMCFIFTSQADETDLIIPMILQGLGAGMLMVPILIFLLSSSPAEYGNTGSAIGICIRFSGFCSSIALLNYFQLWRQSDHLNRFQDFLNGQNPVVLQRLTAYKSGLVNKGIPLDQAEKAANSLLGKSLQVQSQLRFSLDYYQILSWAIFGVIMVIILLPSINSTIINLRNKQPAAIVY